MKPRPTFAIVLNEASNVQDIVAQDYPLYLPLPTFVVVSYDTEYSDPEDLRHVKVGNNEYEALCHDAEVSRASEPGLSPLAVLTDLGISAENDMPDLLTLVRAVHQEVVNVDARLNAAEKSPTGDDYNELYGVAHHGLLQLLKVLGDSTNFGDKE
ncbi:MAG: hypothetical protein LBV29_09375 [Azoarcus sp.]|jgi:hypothetical protein|nr:hypothetical protein [Azoarcus sp.]